MHKSLDMGKLIHVEVDINDRLSFSSVLHECSQLFLSGLSLLLGIYGGAVIVFTLFLPILATAFLICEAVRGFYCYFF